MLFYLIYLLLQSGGNALNSATHMKPTKIGQIVKFHTPNSDEEPDQLYVVLELIEDVERPRADIQALYTGLSFPPVSKVLISDLVVVGIDANDLVGHTVTINKSDFSQVTGRVLKVSEQKINLDLSKGVKSVETNVWLSVKDQNGVEHFGTLYVEKP